ncbi:MAG TPA: hypothetical protein VHA52_07950, partial [Candidatus Babeliaceae bacterium]|nr:hypothetical protein [Candidatus Babeliaceae bacterium]
NATNQSNNNELPNADLYEVARHEADIAYKKVMNARAVLFSLAKCEAWEDPNLPDKINQRAPLAIEVVTAYQKASDLYDRANFVNAYGYLPDQDHTGQQEYTHLQDHLVKLRLDNARKALNKLKAKETTAERIALIQKHEANIRVLEEKWKALKITYEK